MSMTVISQNTICIFLATGQKCPGSVQTPEHSDRVKWRFGHDRNKLLKFHNCIFNSMGCALICQSINESVIWHLILATVKRYIVKILIFSKIFNIFILCLRGVFSTVVCPISCKRDCIWLKTLHVINKQTKNPRLFFYFLVNSMVGMVWSATVCF